LRLSNADEIQFNFTFVSRQQALTNGISTNGGAPQPMPTVDTQIAGLTYIFASNPKEVDNLVVREFHANPNLHKNSNVELVGDYTTGGSASVQFNWSWKWRPPKPTEDRGGGWRSSCSFVEYDQRAHKLNTLAGFDFWVQNSQKYLAPRSPRLDIPFPSRLRVPSTQSIESRVSNVSDSDGESGPLYKDFKEPSSPIFDPIPENGLGLVPTMTASTIGQAGPVKVDVATCKPGEDPATSEDGPLFRATMRSLEQKTGNMRLRMKKVLRTAEAAQHNCNNAVADFTEALREASHSNANAVRPALDHYFEKIAKEILLYERQNSINLHRLIIDPVSKLYNNEIKQADFKKREFDEESKDYYAFTSKYLGQRSESLKEKKQKQSDEKYQVKRRTFELKRFDYSSFMHDLHGGRKDQEVLSQLTKYADAQARSYLTTAKKVEEMVPQLDALIAEVNAAEKDYQIMRTEREEKRRNLEKSTKLVSEDGSVVPTALSYSTSLSAGTRSGPDHSSRVSSYGGLSTSPPSTSSAVQPPAGGILSTPVSATSATNTSPSNKFKGIRDLDDSNIGSSNGTQRKEGLLWALSRPGSHVDPKGLNKQAWHKFWIVLDQGRLSEYVNWKDKLDLHMDPIDLRMASVREARNSDRRFCFEVITPQFTRVYQAPSEEDVKSWIGAINNALQSAFENRATPLAAPAPQQQSSTRKDIAAVLTGKSSSFSGHRQISNPNRSDAQRSVSRHATTGEKPSIARAPSSTDAESSALLQRIRSADEGNRLCADCGTDNKVDWCSINLGILLCIECSGIHRSLGTHISKVRSLTLDTAVFTQDIIEVLMLIGNRVSNMIWEAKLDRFLKPSPQSTREQRLHFITAKYIDHTYVSAGHVMQSPDDLLLTSIKRNDIQNVLLALALSGNPNAKDRSRSTHAVYLALVAADPTAPGSIMGAGVSHTTSSSTASMRTITATSTIMASTTTDPASASPRKPFAIAELLLQNGANIPVDPAPIPLSPAAKLYLEYKTELKLGRNPSATLGSPAQQGQQISATGARDANGDSLSSLPSRAIGSSSGLLGSSSSFGSGATPLEKKDSRTLKRSSGGFGSKISGSTFEGMVRK
jgi:Arf-GAP/SH3 domain/ANK repeat/PH domain-containing protein